MRKRIIKISILALIFLILLSDIKLINNINSKKEIFEKISLYYDNQNDIDIENEYIGTITIPSLDLEEGFYHQLSTKNKLKSGIMVIKNEMDNILVLASHSGISNIAKFNKLSKLNIGQTINLSLQNKEYTYVFSNSYKVEKTGHVYIKYDHNKKTLILITCDLDDNKKQIVYVSYMI